MRRLSHERVFLSIIGGWPKSVFDWDILFLIPLP